MTVEGDVAPGYEPVAEAFAAAVPADGPGGALAAVVDGVPVVDVWAGTRDDAGSPWLADTAAVVFSGTKGVVATAVLVLLERGQLDLSWPVRRLWPEFAAAGKSGILIGDVLGHTAGLPGLAWPLDARDLTDPERNFAALAGQAPITPIGTPSYHALTYGWLVDALVRRSDGRTLGRFVAEELAQPLGLDLWIGLPESALDRVATIRPAPDYALSAFADSATPGPRLALVYGSPPVRMAEWNTPPFLRAEIPAANGVATARALARLYGCLAAGGRIDGIRLLKPETVAAGAIERSSGPDPLTGRMLRFGTGFELAGTPSSLGPADDAFGHTGAGGSSHGAWPGLATGFSFVVSQMRTETRDGRAAAVLAALRAAVQKVGQNRVEQPGCRGDG